MKHLLVPVDGSENACRAAAFAASIARKLGAKVTLIHVYDAPTAAAMGLAHQSKEHIDRAMHEVSRGSFERAKAEMGGFEPSTHVAIGHPDREIVAYARAEATDLIVMGSRGMSVLQGVLLGSVSDRVVRQAPCPVTIVH
ncbi:MAG: universal stress protein [Myxococcales bacterium]|nr:universal stress protein [Myxococcales bacterium]